MTRNRWRRSFRWEPWAAFGAGRPSRFFEGGEVRLAILSLLGEGPRHGYQIMKELEERSGGLYRASAGSVYPTLQQLEDEGLIDRVAATGKRVYRINEAGRAELDDNADAVRRIWRRAERLEDWGRWMGPQVVAVSSELGALAKETMRAASRSARNPELQARIREILEQARRQLEDLNDD